MSYTTSYKYPSISYTTSYKYHLYLCAYTTFMIPIYIPLLVIHFGAPKPHLIFNVLNIESCLLPRGLWSLLHLIPISFGWKMESRFKHVWREMDGCGLAQGRFLSLFLLFSFRSLFLLFCFLCFRFPSLFVSYFISFGELRSGFHFENNFFRLLLILGLGLTIYSANLKIQ